ncbi:hypothetical protein SAMN05216411_106183 [Nitrosospira multiformis]|nr:hypothetical protein SAMN05216411_106183 [Nitrosospira multiformis]
MKGWQSSSQYELPLEKGEAARRVAANLSRMGIPFVNNFISGDDDFGLMFT